ncbi:F-box only protein 33-like [Watersipora subatra]|uniref:F-box only protein 33-like n=1 Tax=Watersipora subatra TaxID=2589382 RepID=UPI00355AEAD6
MNINNNSWGEAAHAKQSFTRGVVTRSQSHKQLEQHLKSNLLPRGQYINGEDYNSSLMLTSSNECSLNLSNIPLFNDKRTGANLQYLNYLKRIISTSNTLKHLSMGFLPTLTLHNNEIVKTLACQQSNSLTSLHLSRCDELREFVYQPVDVQDLLTFRFLQRLSLDTADLSDELLVSLSEASRVQLKLLCLSMFNHEEGVRLVHDRTWTLLHERCPDLELTLNIIRCPQAIRDMMTVINHSMPLNHLRVLFCDEFYVPGFHHVARHQARTLRSLHIVESMREGPMYYDISVDEQDPFVMMAWRCKNLTSFIVIGIALREHDVLAVARLRGMQLRKFEVLEECITAFNQGEAEFEEDFAMSFDTFCEEISTSIGQEWLPLTEDDIDDSIIYLDSPESKAFLPILLHDQQPVLTQSN